MSDGARLFGACLLIVMVLAGLIGIGSLIGGISVWVQGTSLLMPTADLRVGNYIVAVAVGFALLAALAASSTSPAATSPAAAPVFAAAISDRKSFAIRWWEAFRLVLLLAIGPALVALALATAPMAFEVAKKVKLLPGGGSVTIQTNGEGDTYVTTTDASGRANSRYSYARNIRGPVRQDGFTLACFRPRRYPRRIGPLAR